MDNTFSTNVCDAIEIIVNKAIDNASFDKTIQGTILSYVDPSTGKYLVRYQDSVIEAFAASVSDHYENEDFVNILVPGNDMSKEKTIISIANKGIASQQIIIARKDQYQEIGGNCVNASEISLSSYKEYDMKVIYDYTDPNTYGTLNAKDVETGIRQADDVRLAATFRTELKDEQIGYGTYGLVFEIKQQETDELLEYTLTADDINGNPYLLKSPSHWTKVCLIDGGVFKRIQRIYVYSRNTQSFSENSPENVENDIFISNIEFTCLKEKYAKDTQAVELVYTTDEQNATFIATIIDNLSSISGASLDVVPFYWFIEDAAVKTKDNTSFHEYGGLGWACVNKKDNDGAFLPDDYKFSYSLNDFITKKNTIKCVAIYDNNVLAATADVILDADKTDLTIESSSGTKFYKNIGTTELTCKIDGLIRSAIDPDEDPSFDENKTYYRYNWSVTHPYSSTLSLFKNAPTIEIKINNVIGYATYQCLVEKKLGKDTAWSKVGTAALKIIIDKTTTGTFTVKIANGTHLFKYDNHGIIDGFVQDVMSLENTTYQLGFDLYDYQGNILSESVKRACKVKWSLPNAENSLLEFPDGVELTNQTLNFKVKTTYSTLLTDNQIQLEIKYGDAQATAQTDFTFIKEGDPGTNGSNTLCTIVPNDEIGYKYCNYPVFIVSLKSFNFNGSFKVRMFTAGEEVLLTNKDKIEWSMLTGHEDESNFIVHSDNNTPYLCDLTFRTANADPANILRCKVTTAAGLEFFATLPIAISYSSYSSSIIRVKENTGYRFVEYTSEGTYPQYALSKIFEFERVHMKNGAKNTLIVEPISYNNYEIIVHGDTINPSTLLPKDSYNGYSMNNSIEIKTYKDRLIFPIHCYLNNHNLPGLSDWDGNAVYFNNDNGSEILLAPQVAAGKKNEDNSFTGVVMGEIKQPMKDDSEIGLFGYNHGFRTFSIDAETGNASIGGIEIAADQKENGKVVEYGGLQSKDFIAGSRGFRITNDGEAEFNDVKVRGTIEATSGTIGGCEIRDGKLIIDSNTKISTDGKIENLGNNFVKLDTYNNDLNKYYKKAEVENLVNKKVNALSSTIAGDMQDLVSVTALNNYLKNVPTTSAILADVSQILQDYVLLAKLASEIEKLQEVIVQKLKASNITTESFSFIENGVTMPYQPITIPVVLGEQRGLAHVLGYITDIEPIQQEDEEIQASE